MKHEYDCVIVGGGPAGMSAAIALSKLGIEDVLVIERNDALGGILNQCIHLGFGLSRYHEDCSGPEYARALGREFAETGIESRLGAMVLEISKSRAVKVMSSAAGYEELRAKSVIVSTGCRERTRDNLEIAGTRPAGVFTAGQAQTLVNMKGFRIGERAIIQGSGDIGMIMARRLATEGCAVLGVYERLPYLSGLVRNKVQCLDHFNIPVSFGAQICEIVGKDRVEGVFIERVDSEQRPIAGTREFHDCDTVLFSVGLIPEIDILRSSHVVPASARSAAVNSHFELGGSGIFLCGNALHINDLADNASSEGETVAGHVATYLRDPKKYKETQSETTPYAPLTVDKSHDRAFFEVLERDGTKVCIGCPRGCVISESKATCRRGEAYFKESKRGKFQRLTTTISAGNSGNHRRLPVKSLEAIEAGDFAKVKRKLERAHPQKDEPFALAVGERVIHFSSCDR